MDIAAVEAVYVTDWLLKGIYEQGLFARSLVLHGSAVLRYAHCADYPFVEPPDLHLIETLEPAAIQAALSGALDSAAAQSGLQFSLVDFEAVRAKVEYTGPLGRRSAAQPRIVVSMAPGRTLFEPVRVPLVHPFSDPCSALLSVVALEEWIAERIATLGQSPRARDVFDLWFASTHALTRIEPARVRLSTQEVARARGTALPRPSAPFDPAHRGRLELAWDSALRRVPGHPPFAQVAADLAAALKAWLAPR